ncbi:MAG: polyprenyl synthetase family protein [bacterium]
MQKVADKTDVQDSGLCVPQNRERRLALEKAVGTYVDQERLVPPLTSEELADQARCAASVAQAFPDEYAYVAVLLNNALWADVVADIPYERRLLLLPQCLANRAVCQAEHDGLGLLCKQCGGCSIGWLQAEADRLGYVTLVAEGTTVISKLLTSGKVDAVIGVGCMNSLRRIFPVMNAHAIPGQGIPLLTDGCTNTETDVAWALEIIRAGKPKFASRVTAIEAVAHTVQAWFDLTSLTSVLGVAHTEAERIGHQWLMTGGKRWRPILTAAVFEASGGSIGQIMPAALAVECFHKASLIHDDIEDNDDERYGEPTVHKRWGVPAAINAGDYLIGEGYRLLAASDFPGEVRAGMVFVAARGHRELCLGQGEELAFCRQPSPVTESAVLRIYEQKTAAAFEVAVLVGAVAANVDAATCAQLSAFSRAVGTAYQIRDDIEDFRSVRGRAADLLSMRPTLFLAVACTSDHPEVSAALGSVWGHDSEGRQRLIEVIEAAGLHTRVELLYAHYRHETERVLSGIQHAGLKRLLRRVMVEMLR